MASVDLDRAPRAPGPSLPLASAEPEAVVPVLPPPPTVLVLRTPEGDRLAWLHDGEPPPEVADASGRRYLRGRVASGGRAPVLPTPWGDLRLRAAQPLRFAEYFEQPPTS